MGFGGLAVFVLQQVRVGTLERTRCPTGECRGMAPGFDTVTGGLVADQSHVFVVDERMEDTDRVRAATDTRDHRVGQPAGRAQDLLTGLETDNPLEIADHHRERVRSGGGAEAVIGVVRVGDPVAHGLVDRVFQCRRTGIDSDNRGAEQTHPRDVECLALGVDPTHVDDALETEHGTRGGCGHTVLTGPGLGDDALLAHLLGKQRLTQHVVDLVRSGVVQIFSLEEDPCATGVLGKALGLVQRRRASAVVTLEPIEFTQELVVGTNLLPVHRDLFDHGHQGFGYVTPAVDTEVSTAIGFDRCPVDQTGAGLWEFGVEGS